MEEEQSSRDELQRLLAKANQEAAMWRQKAESGEGGVRAEEMDELKRKFNARIAELEAQLEAALAKSASLEKVKSRLQGEMDDLMAEVDKVPLRHREMRPIATRVAWSVSLSVRRRQRPPACNAWHKMRTVATYTCSIVCTCLLVTSVNPAKTVEPIEMPFGNKTYKEGTGKTDRPGRCIQS